MSNEYTPDDLAAIILFGLDRIQQDPQWVHSAQSIGINRIWAWHLGYNGPSELYNFGDLLIDALKLLIEDPPKVKMFIPTEEINMLSFDTLITELKRNPTMPITLKLLDAAYKAISDIQQSGRFPEVRKDTPSISADVWHIPDAQE